MNVFVRPEWRRAVTKDMYDVYHLKAEAWSESHASGSAVRFPDDYEYVARVKARSLEEVYEKTNSLDGPWSERGDVKCVKASRSTSIDDVVVGPAGEVFVLGWNGWALAREAPSQTADVKPVIEPLR